MLGRNGSLFAARMYMVALVATCLFTAALASTEPPYVVRQTMQLTSEWRFSFGDASEDVVASQFDDSAWESVSVPHTWNRLGEPGLQRTAATNNKRGIGWYRLQFKAPAAKRNQRHFLQFDAVGTLADVWLNGSKIGSHAGAFSRFRFDVTDTLRAGQLNLGSDL